uniref:Uncharacterized protein n=1 Tax=Arundo donax TaxID=35708 RepID=A0A0A9BAG6_ARUDO
MVKIPILTCNPSLYKRITIQLVTVCSIKSVI